MQKSLGSKGRPDIHHTTFLYSIMVMIILAYIYIVSCVLLKQQDIDKASNYQQYRAGTLQETLKTGISSVT